MTQMTGRVDRISSKEGYGQKGKWTAYSINVDGNWWGTGFKAPPCSEGDTITFNAGKNSRGYDEAQNIEVVSSAPAATGGAAPTPGITPRDISIFYQNSRNVAGDLLPLMFEQGAIKFPPKTKEADKYDAILDMHAELSAQLFLTLKGVIESGGPDVEDVIPAPGE